MNVFVVSDSLYGCAKALDNKRLRKMILETAQIICSVINLRHGQKVTPYRVSHANHPITLWAHKPKHLRWLWHLGMTYGKEIEYRFGKTHASYEVLKQLGKKWPELTADPETPKKFYNGARHQKLGLDFTHLPVKRAYKAYLAARWPGDKRPPVWTKRLPPSWAKIKGR